MFFPPILSERSLRMRTGGALLAAALVVASCSSGDDVSDVDDSSAEATAEATDQETATDESTDDDGTDEATVADDGTIDLTDAELTSTATSCTDYIGSYTSTVTDAATGDTFMGETTISDNGDTCVLATNSIPSHDIAVDGSFATPVAEVDRSYEIPANPADDGESTQLDFQVNAVMLNGVIWEAFPAACFGEGSDGDGEERIGCGGDLLDHPWRYNVGSDLNRFGADAYLAHTQPNGLYHYHGMPTALYDVDCDGTVASPVIGFARDGFPIFGPCFLDEVSSADGEYRTAQSSYQLKSGVREDVEGYETPYVVGNVVSDEYNGQFLGDFEYVEGSGDLDECNGMEVDGVYGYYVTTDYPYVIACYRGTPSTNFG